MICPSYKQLRLIREKHKNKKIVFCSGVFDITHAGHALFFEDCKKKGDILVVAVSQGGSTVSARKGKNRPIMNSSIRLKMVDSLKPVDYAYATGSTSGSGGNPFKSTEYALKELKPDIYVVNNDAFNLDKRRELAKKYRVRLVVLRRWCPSAFENISTTGIIKKIKQN